ncbi:MAG: TetR/AcrR family transcriptional regulator [Syntrophobacterales bacterium]|nr:TetR/AcrR family transcriptional regulator [Syntrophobacterales bacterium]
MKTNIKEAILETAWKMIRRHGINKTNIDDIARAAMVAKATIYNYFGSKDQVYTEALDRKIGLMAERVSQAVAALPSPLEKLNAFIKESLKMVREESLLFADEHSQSYRFVSRIAAARENFFSAQERLLSGILEQGATEGLFPPQDTAKASKLIGYLMRGFSSPADNHPDLPAKLADTDSEAASLFEILCHGLLSSKEGKT